MKLATLVAGLCIAAWLPTASAGRPIGVMVSASSTMKGKADKYAPWRAVDGETYTAWCEGKKGPGAGETLLVAFDGPVSVRRIEVTVGLNESEAANQKNIQVKELQFSARVKPGGDLVPTGPAVAAVAGFEKPTVIGFKSGSAIAFQVSLHSVAAGSQKKLENACISELKFFDEKNEQMELLFQLPVGAMMTLPMAVTSLRNALEKCDESALKDRVKFPIEHSIQAEDESQVVKIKNMKALIAACKAGDFPKIPPEADKPPGGYSQTLPGRLTLELQGDQLLRFDLVYEKLFWKLVWLEGY